MRTFKMKDYCHGEDHKTFMDALVCPANRVPEPRLLGRMEFPMATDAMVVAMGKLHTRKTLTTLVCQVEGEIIDYNDALLLRWNK